MRRASLILLSSLALAAPASQVAPAAIGAGTQPRCAPAYAVDRGTPSDERELFLRCSDRGVWRFNYCSPIDPGFC